MDITQHKAINNWRNKLMQYNLINKYQDNLKLEKFDDVMDAAFQLNRDIYIGGIDATVADNVEAIIRFWNQVDDRASVPAADRKPIKIYINSPGGELEATFTIIDAIHMSQTPIYTIVTSCAYSGGFFIAIAGHKRFAYPHASYLYHEGSTSMGGDAHKFRNAADFYRKQLQQLKEHTLANTKLSEADYERILKDDYWLLAEEAVEQGVCDEIITEFCYV